MIFRTAVTALVLSACCAASAVAAPTSITEFPSEPKAKYIEGSPLNSSVWITIEGVGIQQYATGDGEPLATARGANNVAASDLAVDVDGSVTWTLPQGAQNPQSVFAGWARRNFTGSITRTPASNANTAEAIVLPSPGASPLITGHYPTGNDCIYTATDCVMTPQDRLDDQLTGLAIDGGGRVWALSQNKDQALRLALGAGEGAPPDKIVTMPAGTRPRRAARGPDGSLWIAGAGDRIVKMTPQGALTSFTLPPGRGPNDIVLGPDSALWFTEKTSNSIGRITTAGRYRSFPVPSAASQPFGIGVGPDQNVWFTEFAGGRIGKIVLGDDLNEGTLLPAKDTAKPRLGSLRFSRTSFRAAGSGASISRRTRKKTPVGTAVRFSLSEAAAVKFTVDRKTKGRRVGRKCKARTRANAKKKSCTRWVKVKGSFTVAAKAGKNSFKFRGRIGGKKLKPARYRLNSQATDKAGNKSALKRKGFKIVK